MILCKIPTTTLVVVIVVVSTLLPLATADYPPYSHFSSFGSSSSDVPPSSSWFDFTQSQHNPTAPRYFDNQKHGTKPIPSILKKIPKENKDSKKSILPYLHHHTDETTTTTTNKAKDHGFLKSHCWEIPAKEASAGASANRHKDVTCYRCKDPKDGSTYENCSYSSKPRNQQSRGPRSNVADLGYAASNDRQKNHHHHQHHYHNNPQYHNPYHHIADDYYHPSASSQPSASSLTNNNNNDKCKEVKRDSMICLVCKDPKTIGKFEQCTYQAEPNQKAYAYTKSSTFGEPKTREQIVKEARDNKRRAEASSAIGAPVRDNEEETEPEIHVGHLDNYPRDDEEGDGEDDKPEPAKVRQQSAEEEEGGEDTADYVPDFTYHHDHHHHPSFEDFGVSSESSKETNDGGSSQLSSSTDSNCKTVHKDDQTCLVCTNPKTGGKSENCNYAYEPKDKVYKYAKSKVFGFPDYTREAYNDDDDGEDRSESREKKQQQPEATNQREAAGSAEEDFSGSVFGDDEDEEEEEEDHYTPSESERVAEELKNSEGKCEEVEKDGMICTICKDPKTGGDFERCNYSYDPKDKIYAYSSSKSSFGPNDKKNKNKKNGRTSSYDSGSEEQPEETFSSPVIYPTSTSELDYQPKGSESILNGVLTTKRPNYHQETTPSSSIDAGFYDAKVRRAEIEKIVSGIADTVDKSKCKKTYRGGMTCYRCQDEKGTNEECVYVAEPETNATNETTTVLVTSKPPSSLDPLTYAGRNNESIKSRQTRATTNSKGRRRRRRSRSRRDDDEEAEENDDSGNNNNNNEKREADHHNEELAEAEAYKYVDETRPVYDEVFGFVLPAYMVEKTPFEIDFDKSNDF